MFSDVQAAKRSLKGLRNLYADPLPRNHTLVFERVEADDKGVDFHYGARGKSYRIRLELPEYLAAGLPALPSGARSAIFSAIGLAFVPFLFKLSDFRHVRVEAEGLDDESVAFFSEFLGGGLGQFRYLQGLNPARPISVQAKRRLDPTPERIATEDRVLMLNGGGKDTIVAGELLKAAGQPFTWLAIRSNPARQAVVALSGNTDAIEVSYILDRGIERDKVYPWGHIPHTSIVLSIGTLVAMLTGSRYVAAGNEYSASFGNLVHRGFEVNHQFTKSFAFEKGFADFVSRCVTPDIKVFSILRPFHDLLLARFFSGHPGYFKGFISCNLGIARNEWCKACPKCAFTALALYPFVGSSGMNDIFGEDVLLRPKIREYILELVGGKVKPWECVGTQEESALALALLLERNPGLRFDTAPSRSDLERAVATVLIDEATTRVLKTTQTEHCIPPELVGRLNTALARRGDPTIPEH